MGTAMGTWGWHWEGDSHGDVGVASGSGQPWGHSLRHHGDTMGAHIWTDIGTTIGTPWGHQWDVHGDTHRDTQRDTTVTPIGTAIGTLIGTPL